MSRTLNVLVACEESQEVTKQLRKLGHRAFSCDIQDCSGGHPEWHICEDVLPLLNGNCSFHTVDGQSHTVEGKWDMLICHPPCTDLAVSGAPSFEKKRADGRQKASIEFFCQFLQADCEYIAVENPVNIISGEYIKKWFPDLCKKYGLPMQPAQKVHPWMFGDNFAKGTCFWTKNLPNLVPEVLDEPEMEWVEWVDKKTGKIKRQQKWYADAFLHCKNAADRSRTRSKTFPGMARAIAEQWGGFVANIE